MYRGTGEPQRISTVHQPDLMSMITDYRYLAAASLADRERREAMRTERAVRRDRILPRASWLKRFGARCCRRNLRRDGALTQPQIIPSVVPPGSLERPAATVGC
jgi:hypothetical protein